MSSVVYVVQNKITGDIYVGKTNNSFFRWRKHQRDAVLGSKSRFHRALRKYGVCSFSFFVAEEHALESDAYQAESSLILYLRAMGATLYNENEGGFGGGSPSDKVRLKISQSRKGFRHSEETKRKMSETRKGRKLSDDHRRHMSEAQKGKQKPFYTRNRKKGILHSEETKRKIAEAARQRWAKIRQNSQEVS